MKANLPFCLKMAFWVVGSYMFIQQSVYSQTVSVTGSYLPSSPSMKIKMVVALNGHPGPAPNLNYVVRWGDGNTESTIIAATQQVFTHEYSSPGIYYIQYDVFDITAVPWHHEDNCPKTRFVEMDIPYQNQALRYDVNRDGIFDINDVNELKSLLSFERNLPVQLTSGTTNYFHESPDVDGDGFLSYNDIKDAVAALYALNCYNPNNRLQFEFLNFPRDFNTQALRYEVFANGASELGQFIGILCVSTNRVVSAYQAECKSTPGTYQYKLLAKFPDLSVVQLDEIEVTVPPIKVNLEANFTPSQTQGNCNGLTQTFTSGSNAYYSDPYSFGLFPESPLITGYNWYINNSLVQSGASSNLTYPFPIQGNYEVCLVVNASGFGGETITSQSYCQSIYVGAPDIYLGNSLYDPYYYLVSSNQSSSIYNFSVTDNVYISSMGGNLQNITPTIMYEWKIDGMVYNGALTSNNSSYSGSNYSYSQSTSNLNGIALAAGTHIIEVTSSSTACNQSSSSTRSITVIVPNYMGGSDNNPPTGYTGSSGDYGYSGNSGYTGSSGYSGSSGDYGYSGYSGSDGSSGYYGYSGYDGSSGYSGSSGDYGYSGSSGDYGYSGYSGSDGSSGYYGYSGSDGSSGYMGSSGDYGYSGYYGYSGSDGSSGDYNYSGYYRGRNDNNQTNNELKTEINILSNTILNVSCSKPPHSALVIKVFDMTGKLVSKRQVDMDFDRIYNFDLANKGLKTGLYLVNVKIANENVTKKVLLQSIF